MRYKQLYPTAMNLSAVVLGTDDFGTTVEKSRAFEVMDKYYELGGNVLDTARVYAAWFPGGAGMSEKTVGEWVKARKVRDNVFVSTKCSHPPLEDMSVSRLSYGDMISDVDESLKALGTDYIDILWLHRDDRSKPIEQIVEALERVKQSGKVRAFGVSNWRADRIDAANKLGGVHIVASQIKWSYAKTRPSYEDDPTLVEMDSTEMEYYKTHRISVFAFASQAKGFFSKIEKGGVEALSGKSAQRYFYDGNVKRYEAASAVAKRYGVPVSVIVLAYINSRHDINGYAIAGCKNVLQVQDSLKNTDFVLSPEELAFLEGAG